MARVFLVLAVFGPILPACVPAVPPSTIIPAPSVTAPLPTATHTATCTPAETAAYAGGGLSH